MFYYRGNRTFHESSRCSCTSCPHNGAVLAVSDVIHRFLGTLTSLSPFLIGCRAIMALHMKFTLIRCRLPSDRCFQRTLYSRMERYHNHT